MTSDENPCVGLASETTTPCPACNVTVDNSSGAVEVWWSIDGQSTNPTWIAPDNGNRTAGQSQAEVVDFNCTTQGAQTGDLLAVVYTDALFSTKLCESRFPYTLTVTP